MLSFARDGSVVSATIGSDPIPGLERAWRAFAESARRAVQIASPLPIPAGKYETFRNMTLIFRPEDAIW